MYKNYTVADVRKAAEQKLFTVFSTFAGGGGSSTGYKLAGGDVRGVLEFQKVGVRTYLQNYPGTKFFCKDIRNVTGEQVLRRLRMEPGELDLFDGSPPCPPFSMSGSKRKGWNKTKTVYGKKQTNIEDLSFDMARLVGVVKPKTFICENVKGMTMDYAKDHFHRIINAFEEHGYETSARVLNANNYGVPQGRERVFIIGVREDVLPHPLAMGNAFPDPLEVKPTMRHAIGDMMEDEKNLEEHEEIMESMKKQKRWKYLSTMPLDVEKYVELGKYVYDGMKKEKEEDPEAPDPKYSGFQVRRVPWDKPSHTLTERGLQTGTCAHLHPGEHRGFTSWEARRIMSLPGDYHLDGSLNDRLARIGLMVAPLQMYHLAKHVYETYLRGYNGK